MPSDRAESEKVGAQELLIVLGGGILSGVILVDFLPKLAVIGLAAIPAIFVIVTSFVVSLPKDWPSRK